MPGLGIAARLLPMQQISPMAPLSPSLAGLNPGRSGGSGRWLLPLAIALSQVACAQTPATPAADPAPKPIRLAQPVAVAPQAATVPASAAMQAPAAAASAWPADRLPAEVEAALQRGKVAPDAVSVVVMDVSGAQRPLLDVHSDVGRNPASVMKLVTTYAALEILGPAYTWDTRIATDGQVAQGALNGNLYVQGSGDPKLVMERLWLLQRRLLGQGIQVIVGDVVLDRSAFSLPPIDPARFDNEPYRPYNAVPDALLLNYKSLTMRFIPDATAGVARIAYEPAVAHLRLPSTVPLLKTKGNACGDWRGALKAQLSDATQIQFLGGYPAACGENSWAVAACRARPLCAPCV